MAGPAAGDAPVSIGADLSALAIVDAIRQLTTPVGPTHDRKIGYHQGNR